MRHIMFDVDGTLVESYALDQQFYIDAVSEVLGTKPQPGWAEFLHVTDAGILDQYLDWIGFEGQRADTHQRVEQAFVARLEAHLRQHPMTEIPGACAFFARLKQLETVQLSIATGGWLASALLKLQSAGLDISGVPIASSSDHYIRVEIMRVAAQRAGASPGQSMTYLGDGPWDQQACQELGYEFLLVGSRIEYNRAIPDYRDWRGAFDYLGIDSDRR